MYSTIHAEMGGQKRRGMDYFGTMTAVRLSSTVKVHFVNTLHCVVILLWIAARNSLNYKDMVAF